jgi:hypothetical protein
VDQQSTIDILREHLTHLRRMERECAVHRGMFEFDSMRDDLSLQVDVVEALVTDIEHTLSTPRLDPMPVDASTGDAVPEAIEIPTECIQYDDESPVLTDFLKSVFPRT